MLAVGTRVHVHHMALATRGMPVQKLLDMVVEEMPGALRLPHILGVITGELRRARIIGLEAVALVMRHKRPAPMSPRLLRAR